MGNGIYERLYIKKIIGVEKRRSIPGVGIGFIYEHENESEVNVNMKLPRTAMSCRLGDVKWSRSWTAKRMYFSCSRVSRCLGVLVSWCMLA